MPGPYLYQSFVEDDWTLGQGDAPTFNVDGSIRIQQTGATQTKLIFDPLDMLSAYPLPSGSKNFVIIFHDINVTSGRLRNHLRRFDDSGYADQSYTNPNNSNANKVFAVDAAFQSQVESTGGVSKFQIWTDNNTTDITVAAFSLFGDKELDGLTAGGGSGNDTIFASEFFTG